MHAIDNKTENIPIIMSEQCYNF